jgi:hypothetical protein
MLSDLKSKLIVCSVDITGIVDHHSLNFLPYCHIQFCCNIFQFEKKVCWTDIAETLLITHRDPGGINFDGSKPRSMKKEVQGQILRKPSTCIGRHKLNWNGGLFSIWKIMSLQKE